MVQKHVPKVSNLIVNNILCCVAQVECLASWSGWSSWSKCSTKCGLGKKYRRRICLKEISGSSCGMGSLNGDEDRAYNVCKGNDVNCEDETGGTFCIAVGCACCADNYYICIDFATGEVFTSTSLASLVVLLVVIVIVGTLISAALVKYRSRVASIFNQSNSTFDYHLPIIKQKATAIPVKDFRYSYINMGIQI
jgi:hypothetical protein